MSFYLVFNIFFALANFWIWRIFKINLILSILLLALSVLIFSLVIKKLSKKFWSLVLILFLVIASMLTVSGFDMNLKVLSPNQQLPLGERHNFLSKELGVIFENKYSLHFYKDIYPYLRVYESNLFSSLSPNLYFFTSHPRERAGVEEFLKFPSIFILPFLIGLINIPRYGNKFLLAYVLLSLIIQGFIKQNYILGPVLFFPLVNLVISLGFIKIVQIFSNEG